MHGAINESQHIFINAGLSYLIHQMGLKSFSILEIGFGTGLNAFLSLIQAKEQKLTIQYTALEQFPLDMDIVRQLNYAEKLGVTKMSGDFRALHETKDGTRCDIFPGFSFKLIKSSFENFDYPPDNYDIIYFDPFDPAVQKIVWEREYLSRVYNSVKGNGMLITYGAKGSFKRALKSLSFNIESLPGPTGKREITRAIK
jgi:tRNA U34 5-methylaminomethyl-2-thiouridine-forming methyltransferase MnmC